MGAYPYKCKCKSKDLVDYESSLPSKYDVPMKGLLISQKRFDKFSDEQQQKLLNIIARQ